MIVTYKPAGSAARTWDFSPRDLPMSRATIIERAFGGEKATIDQWTGEVMRGGAHARRVLIWSLLSVEHATLRLADVDPKFGEVEVDFSLAEMTQLRDEVAAKRVRGDQAKAEKAEMLAMLDQEIDNLRERIEEEKASGAEPQPEGDTCPPVVSGG